MATSSPCQHEIKQEMRDSSGPQEKFKAVVPNIFGTRDRFCGRQFFHDGGGMMVQAVMRMMRSVGEQCRAADETLLAPPPLTSCCAAQFLTGRGPGWGPLV